MHAGVTFYREKTVVLFAKSAIPAIFTFVEKKE
jgi:hypothetical protein